MEPHVRAILREHSVDHERVDVDVEIHRPTPGSPLRGLCAVGWKALDDGHRAAATVPDAGLAGHMAQKAEDRTFVFVVSRGIPASRR